MSNKRSKKYIFITGGVASSLGKGLAAASIASLIERRGIKVNMLKMDPYINVDPGTMSPTQHGEVFVTDDGAETDLDLGHYERFTSLTLSKKNNFTTGQVYLQVIENERDRFGIDTISALGEVGNDLSETVFRQSLISLSAMNLFIQQAVATDTLPETRKLVETFTRGKNIYKNRAEIDRITKLLTGTNIKTLN